MKHDELKILVSAYHDGEVTAAERAQVEAHLAECAECTEALAAYGRMGQTVHNLPQGAPSRGLWLRVQEGLAPRRRSFWLRFLPTAPALALLAIAITLFIVLGGPLGGSAPTQPAAREVQSPGGQQLVVVPEVLPAAAPTAAAYDASGGQYPPAAMPSPCAEGYANLTAVGEGAPCPGVPLALELVSVSVRSDKERAAPRLQGVLYDAEGRGLPDVTLVVSGTAGWQCSVTTGAGGAFALDLPERGTYRVVLALAPVAAKVQSEEYNGPTDDYQLPDGAICQGRVDMALAPLVLDVHDEAVVTLRVR